MRTIKKFRAPLVFVLAAAFGAGHECIAQDSQPDISSLTYAANLSSGDAGVRWNAEVGLVQNERKIRAALLRSFDESIKLPDAKKKKVGGVLDVTIRTFGDLRVDEAVNRLVSIMDFQLDKKTLGYDRESIHELYPAAESLSKIGGKTVLDSLFMNLTYPFKERYIPATAWILREMLRQPEALALVQSRLDRLNSRHGATADSRSTGTTTANLAKLRDLLKENGPLLTTA